MSITVPTYCTREQVKNALDLAETFRTNERIDRAIESASDQIDGMTRRRFSPTIDTRYFSWPSEEYRTPWRLWLDGNELVSLTSCTSGGATLTADVFLEAQAYGPPYAAIEVDLDSSSAFSSSGTHQRSIAVTGVFGYTDDQATVGTLASSLAASLTASPSITWTDLAGVGVGTLLQIDTERLLVIGRTMVDTTQNVGGSGLTNAASSVALTVSDGTAFSQGEVLYVETERMQVLEIAGNVLTVKRAIDGTVLAAHSAGVDVYAQTGVLTVRAAQGSTLAAHNSAATVTRHVLPPAIRDFALGIALSQLLQEQAGYARTAGTADMVRLVTGKGLESLEEAALERHGRQILMRSV